MTEPTLDDEAVLAAMAALDKSAAEQGRDDTDGEAVPTGGDDDDS